MISFLPPISAHSTDTNNVTTPAQNSTGANLIVVHARWWSGSGGSVTLSDSKSNTWTPLTKKTSAANYNSQLFYSFNPTVGTGHTFTLTGSGTTPVPGIDVTIVFNAASSPFDVQNGATGSNSTTLQPGSVTPGAAPELVITGMAGHPGTALLLDTGFVYSFTNDIGGTAAGGGMGARSVANTNAINPTWNCGAGNAEAATIATFKSANSTTATGKVQFAGTPISGGDNASFPSGYAFDNDYTTTWGSSGTNGWIGMDVGVSSTVTAFEMSPQPSTASNTEEARVFGAQLQSAAASNFLTPTTYYTVAAAGAVPAFPPGLRNRTSLGAGGSAQYWRLNFTSGTTSSLNELRFIGTPSTAPSRPIAPRFSPWGGVATSGSTTVTITCETTSASIYYTTDGSAPTINSTLYTGPFTVSVGTLTTVRAIAFDTNCSRSVSEECNPAYWRNYEFKARGDWYDNNGDIAESKDFAIVNWPVGSTHYLAFSNSGVGGTGTNDTIGRYGIWVYSFDLTTTGFTQWQNLGNIIGCPTEYDALLNPSPMVCPGNGLLTLWCKGYKASPNLEKARSWSLASGQDASVPGNWTDHGDFLPDDATSFADFSRFIWNGAGYVIYTQGVGQFTVSKLSSDYLSTVGTAGNFVKPTGYSGESPVAFQVGTKGYVIFDSVGNYYDSTSTFSRKTGTFTDPLTIATYSAPVAFDAVDPVGTDYNCQPRSIFQWPGKVSGSVVMIADYWLGGSSRTLPPPNQEASRSVLVPLNLSGAVAAPTAPATWDATTFTNSAPSSGGSGAALMDVMTGGVFALGF